MGFFGKPPAGAGAAREPQTGPAKKPAPSPTSAKHPKSDPPKSASGKHVKPNSSAGGKAFGSPTSVSGVSGVGFEPSWASNEGGDRWSYGGQSSGGSADEWGAHGERSGTIWQSGDWNRNDDRETGW